MPKYIDLLRTHGANRKPPDTKAETDDAWLVEEAGAAAHEANADGAAAAQQLLEEEPAPEMPDSETVEPGEHAILPPPVCVETSADDAINRTWIETCIRHTLELFRHAARNEPASPDALREHVAGLLADIKEHPDRLEAIELIVANSPGGIRKADSDLGDLVEKSVMMMIYAIKMGQQLRLNDDELLALVLAGMLHHIGMAQVPANIRHKKKKLTSEERQAIAAAPENGAAWLKQSGIEDARILTAASEARERFDGSGPKGLKGTEISRTARIIGLLSTFEAMTHYRAYRKRLLPRDAIREILVNHKQAFDPAFLKCLIDAISLYPVGTFVQLNSGDIGQVIHVHQRLPLRPVVHLTLDRHGNGIVPRTVDLHSQPNLMVERCMYPEDVAEISRADRKPAPATAAD